MIFSNLNNEFPINIRYYSSDLDTVYNLFDIINFTSGLVSGSINEPVEFYIDQGGSLDNRYQSSIPNNFDLYDAYPNPFNPKTTLRYDLPQNSMVTITIYDMLGRAINTIVNEVQNAGNQSIIWDGTNSSGNRVSSGTYIYQIEAGDYHNIKQMVLLK